ncbi:hypothetical protein AO262_32890 [Pseudomonas fluorescens ABAC62]|nr:hypothetical protein AO262_32890 [Pseudomonas fluorescens ABAC62]
MSVSINSSRPVNVDISSLDQTSSTSRKTDVSLPAAIPSAQTRPALPSNDPAAALKADGMLASGALIKLFDMLDMVFKALREMLSGRSIQPGLSPEPAKRPGNTPDVREQPVKPEARQPHALPVMPPMPKPDVAVTKNADANVQVNVSVSHCHCPDTKARPAPAVLPRPQATHDMTPPLRPVVTPKPTTSVIADNKSVPDLTRPVGVDNRFDPNGWRFNSESKLQS